MRRDDKLGLGGIVLVALFLGLTAFAQGSPLDFSSSSGGGASGGPFLNLDASNSPVTGDLTISKGEVGPAGNTNVFVGSSTGASGVLSNTLSITKDSSGTASINFPIPSINPSVGYAEIYVNAGEDMKIAPGVSDSTTDIGFAQLSGDWVLMMDNVNAAVRFFDGAGVEHLNVGHSAGDTLFTVDQDLEVDVADVRFVETGGGPTFATFTTGSATLHNVLPQADSTYNLGQNTLSWDSLWLDAGACSAQPACSSDNYGKVVVCDLGDVTKPAVIAVCLSAGASGDAWVSLNGAGNISTSGL